MPASGVSALFSGNSRFATDFQQIIERGVAIASLPLQQMQGQQKRVSEERSALGALETRFAALSNTIAQLSSSLSSLTASSSEASVAGASVSSAAMTGVYPLEILSAGSHTSTLSADGLAAVADPASQNISSAGSFVLTVNGRQHEIRPASSSLTSLAEALNASGAGVEATVINVGSPSAPDYRLAVRATKLGAVSIDLSDGSQTLLDTLATGALAAYRIQGQQGDPITSDTRNVTLAPGLSVTLLNSGSTEIRVERNAGAVAAAVNGFVSAYNAAAAELDGHRGQEGGALKGTSLVNTLAAALRSLAAYEGQGAGTLVHLGLTFGQDGRLAADPSVLNAAAQQNWAEVLTFFGTAAAPGFLKNAEDILGGITGAGSGALTVTGQGLASEETSLANRMAAEQDRISQLRIHLEARMAAADALIASLEQQASYMRGLFQTMMEGWSRNR